MEKIPLIVVCGATASGKTALGIHIAKKFNGQVISADSMQIYRRLDIGTAKPTIEEQEGIVHRMIDIAEAYEAYSVADYCEKAHKEIEEVRKAGYLPVIVGGTGLYIDNLVANTDFSTPKGDEEIRRRLEKEAEEYGNEVLYQRLKSLDPIGAEKVHPNNLKRLIRAMELLETTGETRDILEEKSKRPSPYEPLWFAIEHPREVLYERINKRVDIMLEQGLVEEVRRELMPIRDKAATAMQAIGYKEIIECLDGKTDLLEATEKIKQNSRRYAKRQLTWFRRNNEINWLSPENPKGEAEKIINEFFERRHQHEIIS